ncbi:conserved protein of unknown function [Candidatus Promineifilum breve]|uniref:Uncharacterized protein n=1 Tax=Candidatus Promineifilum breve TaxID=1806508 RepID=A0A160T403_9CHLR|nr:hypothetical protein [Candidatus Promineifilum breve]CUS04786.2 conserved protein of unknown function [Candidatus Promineifilum breve]
MNTDDFEGEARHSAAEWAFVQLVETVDKTDHAIKLRLHINPECFVQIYANVQKELYSYTLVLNRSRLYGRDCDGKSWHRHPYDDPESHDKSLEGRKAVTLEQFLAEVQQILQAEGLL